MINWMKDQEKDIDPEKLYEYKRQARMLAKAFRMENSVNCWWVDLDGEIRCVVHDPNEHQEKE